MTDIKTDASSVTNNLPSATIPFSEFIEALKEKMKLVFHVRADADDMALKRGLPPFVMRDSQKIWR